MGYIDMDLTNETRPDDVLVASFCQGNNEAFEELVLRYKNPLYQYILSLVKDESTAEDLFQDVFISFFKHARSYRAQGKFKAWLFLTARNKVINHWRDHKQTASLDQTDEDGNAFLQEILPDQAPSALDELSFREFEASVARAIDQLPPRQREMIYLRQFMSFQEIAETVGRPLGTVLADCHRAVKKIRQILGSQTAHKELL